MGIAHFVGQGVLTAGFVLAVQPPTPAPAPVTAQAPTVPAKPAPKPLDDPPAVPQAKTPPLIYHDKPPIYVGVSPQVLKKANMANVSDQIAAVNVDGPKVLADQATLTADTATQTADVAALGASLAGTPGVYDLATNTAYLPDGKGGYTTLALPLSTAVAVPTTPAPVVTPVTPSAQ